jgi:transcriptional regulator with XRE-family HTH domain
MHKTPKDWVTFLKESKGWSWYRTARMLEITDQALDRIRQKNGNMSLETALRLADLLELGEREQQLLLTDLKIHGAKSDKVRELWSQTRRILEATGAALLLAVILSQVPERAIASTGAGFQPVGASEQTIRYARLVQLLARLLSRRRAARRAARRWSADTLA